MPWKDKRKQNEVTLARYHRNRDTELPKRRDRARQKQIQRAGYAPSLCEICGIKSDRALHYDHNHTTGRFRGWLCGTCNKGLGLFRDSPDTLRRAVAYLTTRGHSGT